MSRLIRFARFLTPAAMGVALSIAPALAQVTTPVVNADSQSTTNTTQGNAQNMIFNSAQPLRRSEVVTTPDAIAPSIAGGNPCVINGSIGVSGMGFGVSGGLGIQDPECETRQQVALLVNMGAIDVAIARFCMEAEIREAFRLAGKPCPDEVAAAETAAAQPRAVQPAAIKPAAIRPAAAQPKPAQTYAAAPATARQIDAVSTPAAQAPAKRTPAAVADQPRASQGGQVKLTYNQTNPGDETHAGPVASKTAAARDTLSPALQELRTKRFLENLQGDRDR